MHVCNLSTISLIFVGSRHTDLRVWKLPCELAPNRMRQKVARPGSGRWRDRSELCWGSGSPPALCLDFLGYCERRPLAHRQETEAYRSTCLPETSGNLDVSPGVSYSPCLWQASVGTLFCTEGAGKGTRARGRDWSQGHRAHLHAASWRQAPGNVTLYLWVPECGERGTGGYGWMSGGTLGRINPSLC